MMKSKIKKDFFRRKLFKIFYRKKLVFKMLKYNSIFFKCQWKKKSIAYKKMIEKLNLLPLNSSIVRLKNRCILTGRARGVHRNFKISRLRLRALISKGFIPHVYK